MKFRKKILLFDKTRNLLDFDTKLYFWKIFEKYLFYEDDEISM